MFQKAREAQYSVVGENGVSKEALVATIIDASGGTLPRNDAIEARHAAGRRPGVVTVLEKAVGHVVGVVGAVTLGEK